jgi:hypothetical protein
METNPEIIRTKINQIKIDLEQKTLNYKSYNSEITLLYSCIFKKITYKGQELDNELIEEINQSILQAKSKFGEGYTKALNEMGIRL